MTIREWVKANRKNLTDEQLVEAFIDEMWMHLVHVEYRERRREALRFIKMVESKPKG